MITCDRFYRVLHEMEQLDIEIVTTMEEYEELFGRRDYKDFDYEDWTITNDGQIHCYGTDRIDNEQTSFLFPLEFLFAGDSDRKAYVEEKLEKERIKKKMEKEARQKEEEEHKRWKEAYEYKQYLLLKKKFEGKENAD